MNDDILNAVVSRSSLFLWLFVITNELRDIEGLKDGSSVILDPLEELIAKGIRRAVREQLPHLFEPGLCQARAHRDSRTWLHRLRAAARETTIHKTGDRHLLQFFPKIRAAPKHM